MLVLALIGVHWAQQHFVPLRSVADNASVDPRLSFQAQVHLVQAALNAYHALPPKQQQALRQDIEQSFVSVDTWRDALNLRSWDMLCLGEWHVEATRHFIANELLPQLEFDVLLLEGDQAFVQSAWRRFQLAQPVPELLDAPLAPLFNAIDQRHVAIFGVDESPRQRRARLALVDADLARQAREDTIVGNLRRRWQRGARHVVIFGALHCRRLPGWFFSRLAQESELVQASRSHNAVVLGRYQEPGVQMLMYVLEELGMHRDTLIIPDTTRFPALILEWLPPIAQAFGTYETAIVYDDARFIENSRHSNNHSKMR